MKKVFVLHNLVGGGYFVQRRNEILWSLVQFATKFGTYQEAEAAAKSAFEDRDPPFLMIAVEGIFVKDE